MSKIKTLFSALFVILLCGLVKAQQAGYTITNFKLTGVSSPDTLSIKQYIEFSYDYQQAGTNVKLVVLPVFKGPASSLTSATRTLTTATGSSTGFVSLSDTGRVTGILFRFFDSNGTLAEKTFPINFAFRKFGISNVKFTPASPATLATGTQVTFTFDFIQTADTVTLAALPVYSGTGNAYRSGNNILTTTQGNRSGFVNYVGEGKITGVLFRFFNSKSGILYEEEVPVDYTYKGFDISNVKFTSVSPDTLMSGTQVVFTYDFVQSADTVTLAALPVYEGTGTAYRSGNHTLTTKEGNRSGFVNYVGEGKIKGVLFRFFNAKSGILYEEEVPVNYTYIKYSVTNIRFAPASPDTLLVGKQVTFTYNYSKVADTVLVIAVPSFSGSRSRIGSGNITLTATSGSGQGFFSLPDSGHVSGLTLRFYKGDVKVYETSVPCNFYFFDYNISGVVFSPPSPDTLPLSQTVQFSYRYFQNSGTIKLVASPSYKGKGLGYTSSATRTFDTPTGTSTGYVGLLADGKVDQITFRMFSDTGTVYTKSYKVNYTFGNPIITAMDEEVFRSGWQLFPNPASDYFTIRFATPHFLYEMVDVSGKVVKQEEVAGNEVSVATQDLSKGIYTLKISDGISTEFRKMVVQ